MKKTILAVIAASALAVPQSAAAEAEHPCVEDSPTVQASCYYGNTHCYAWVYSEWKDPLLPPYTRVCVTVRNLT